ncbi:MAG TPA: ATP-binding protein, partial [Deinococcales bacterium]|nr:ATP-binding protein [Deinococcales bacterium]
NLLEAPENPRPGEPWPAAGFGSPPEPVDVPRVSGVGLMPLLDLLDVAVIAIQDGVVTGLNAAAVRLFVIHPQLAVGRPVIEVLRNHRLEALAGTGGELEVAAGPRTLVARGLPEGPGRAGGLVIRDVTAERERERQSRELLATLAHEFRTPVTGIKGLLEALLTDPPREARERFVRIAAQEAERLARLTEDLTTSLHPPVERTFAVGEALERALSLLNPEFAERGTRLEATGLDTLVRCDPEKLLQVLLNLLQNAARHGPPGGRVCLAAGPEPGGALAGVRVTDEGRELRDYSRLFRPHERGETSAPGTGMGLAVVRSIVKAWGGTVWARYDGQANAGLGGNEFGFTVPVPDAQAAPGGNGRAAPGADGRAAPGAGGHAAPGAGGSP